MRKHKWLALLLLASGCSNESSPNPSHSSSNTFRISAEAYGPDWPLTISEGILMCERRGMIAISTQSGTYALNGHALTHGRSIGWRRIDSIWKPDPSDAESKMYLGDLIQMGVALCEGKRPALPSPRNPPSQKVEPEESAAHRIDVSRFNLGTKQNGMTLTVSLDTDLPPNTIVMLSVGRPYWREDGEAYSAQYILQRMTVADLAVGYSIELRPNIESIKQEVERRNRIFRAAGQPNHSVSRIADEVTVKLTVPINQPAPFSRSNRNLFGPMVPTSGLRVINKDMAINFPASDAEKRAIRS